MRALCAGILDVLLDLLLNKVSPDGTKQRHNAANLQKAIDEDARLKNDLLACGAPGPAKCGCAPAEQRTPQRCECLAATPRQVRQQLAQGGA